MTYIHNYDYDYFKRLYLEHWEQRSLRFADAFPAIAYSFGITYQQIADTFPEMQKCAYENDTHMHRYTVSDQISFIKQHATRTPTRVLEIGAGRGEVACTFTELGVPTTAVEIATGAEKWLNETSLQFFNTTPSVVLINDNITNANINFSEYDTIAIVESFEHIPKEDFDSVWENIKSNFHGLFIITNWLEMHPMPVGGDWPGAYEEHCRAIDDALFDEMANSAAKIILKERSHLVLEF